MSLQNKTNEIKAKFNVDLITVWRTKQFDSWSKNVHKMETLAIWILLVRDYIITELSKVMVQSVHWRLSTSKYEYVNSALIACNVLSVRDWYAHSMLEIREIRKLQDVHITFWAADMYVHAYIFTYTHAHARQCKLQFTRRSNHNYITDKKKSMGTTKFILSNFGLMPV